MPLSVIILRKPLFKTAYVTRVCDVAGRVHSRYRRLHTSAAQSVSILQQMHEKNAAHYGGSFQQFFADARHKLAAGWNPALG